MAFYRCGSGGGDGKVYIEKLVMESNESKTINLGYKPKFVWFGKNATSAPLISCYYNEETSTTQYLQATGGTMRWLTLGTGVPSIDITETGFTVKNSANANANMQIVALG